jgi:amino acid adenylation domain-containing protein/thioester reductase-like protein/non-ribosomal peptide synthase protein (TIGR01720 family)
MLLRRIRQHSRDFPREKAVVSWDAELEYGELYKRGVAISAELKRLGIGRGHVVAIYMARSAAVIVSLLGTMLSRAAYTIIELDSNQDRGITRLRTIAANLVIARDDSIAPIIRAGLRCVSYEDAVSTKPGSVEGGGAVAASDVAYVLYTSGSTGVPKGVAVTHANIEHYIVSFIDRIQLHDPMGYAHVSALSADLGNTSLLLSLWTGGTLHVIDDETRRDARKFGDYIYSRHISFVKITPSHFAALFRGLAPRGELFEYLVLGGEALTFQLAREILAAGITRVLVNHYGPTETTVGVTAHVMHDIEDLVPLRGNTVPIGSAFGATRLYVRTEAGSFERHSARGELYVGGPSVAVGYIDDEKSTRDRFVTGIEGDLRFYRTGDLCQVDDSGVFEFLGRLDRQVKINGYRVELDHIEASLCGLPGVRGANAFLLRTAAKPSLVAAYLGEGEVEEASLLEALRTCLPGHMVPSRLIRLQAFPLNPNGKVDGGLLEATVAELLMDRGSSGDALLADSGSYGVDPIRAHVIAAWRVHLGHSQFGDDDDFFGAGGDSITAIQVISDLQVRGYDLTPTQFIEQPTIRALVEVIETNSAHVGGERAHSPIASMDFSAAQNWFFRQKFANPDYWNQSVLLRSDMPVDENILERALASILGLHPMLRCCYRERGQGWEVRTLESLTSPCLSVRQLADVTTGNLTEAIKSASESLNRRINLASGDLFKVCLLKAASGPDHILAICHHLSVDAVSWRIVVDDLVRFYDAYSRDQTLHIRPSATEFWDWVLHVKQNHAQLERDLGYWRESGSAVSPLAGPRRSAGENREELASTLWIRFSAEEMDLLSSRLLPMVNAQMHVALLGAFAYAYRKVIGRDRLVADVESHGRISFDQAIDVSRVVGWFTSTFPVRLELKDKGLEKCISEARCALARVPNLGIAYGELYGTRAWEGLATAPAEVCYNYLGDFHFRHDDRLRLVASRYSPGPARGPENDRVYDLKLTGRTANGELVVDLSFSQARHPLSRMRRLLGETRDALLREVGFGSATAPDPLVENWSSSGLLTYIPEALRPAAEVRQKSYRQILLTGATGYLGVHVLHELLRQTRARIYCLVRETDIDSGRVKLADTYRYHLGAVEALDLERITVVLGDISRPGLGLSDEAFSGLAMRLDAIYHFAADTRLFGPAESFERHNVDAVRWLIRLATSYRPKDLHHMSTLAVAGVNRGDERKVFSELCLDIGQDFQNEYERSKFLAEKLVAQFRAEGGAAYIYRSGNISGRSDDARFRRDAADNRLVQLLRAICKAGKRPESIDEIISLSPVDAVALAIVSISLDPEVAAGVFHVDTIHEVPFSTIIDQLQEIGFRLEGTNRKNFRAVFEALDSAQDPDLALGLFWTSRPPRNVVFDHGNTHRLLDGMGCAVPALGEGWLRRYLNQLVEDSVLKPRDEAVLDACAEQT